MELKKCKLARCANINEISELTFISYNYNSQIIYEHNDYIETYIKMVEIMDYILKNRDKNIYCKLYKSNNNLFNYQLDIYQNNNIIMSLYLCYDNNTNKYNLLYKNIINNCINDIILEQIKKNDC